MRFIILLISISFIASCTVQKRVHRKGWHVEWKKNYKPTSPKSEVHNTSNTEILKSDAQTPTSSSDDIQKKIVIDEKATEASIIVDDSDNQEIILEDLQSEPSKQFQGQIESDHQSEKSKNKAAINYQSYPLDPFQIALTIVLSLLIALVIFILIVLFYGISISISISPLYIIIAAFVIILTLMLLKGFYH